MDLEPPVPALSLVRLDATTHIGRIHLRHPAHHAGRAPDVADDCDGHHFLCS
jgi:hypothetical protein